MDASEVDPSELRALLDKERIRELLARWARAVDRGDNDTIADCYLAESVDSHGAFSGTGREFAERPMRRSGAMVAKTHTLGQSIIDLDGDTAHCETYFLCPEVQKIDEELIFIHIQGRYLDVVRKVSGRWLIESRRVVLDWAYEEPAAKPWKPLNDHPRSKLWPDDEVYSRESHEWPGYRQWARG
jgi:ketosteroid isomerase-like protein